MNALQQEDRARQTKIAKEMEALEQRVSGMEPSQIYQSVYAVMNNRHEHEMKALASQQRDRKVKQVAGAVESLDATLTAEGADLESEDASKRRQAARADATQAADEENHRAQIALKQQQVEEIERAIHKFCPNDAKDIVETKLSGEVERFAARLKDKPKIDVMNMFGGARGARSSPRAASQKFLKLFAGGNASKTNQVPIASGPDQAAMMKSFQQQEEKQKEMLLTVRGMEAKLGKIDDLFAKLESIEQLVKK